MLPILAGLGAAFLALSMDDGESKANPAPAIPKKSKPKKSDGGESAAAAFDRATKERDSHWKAEIKRLKSNHKQALSAFKETFSAAPAEPSAPEVGETPKESDSDEE